MLMAAAQDGDVALTAGETTTAATVAEGSEAKH